MKTADFTPPLPPLTEVDPQWAWEEFVPSAQNPWDLRKVGHLYRRAAFGARWGELQRAVKQGPAEAVASLTEPPDGLDAFSAEYDALVTQAARTQGVAGIRAWWLRRMIESPFPLEEKLTLFWHSHFAVSGERVRDASVFLDYLTCLRRRCFDSWEAILAEVCQHPAFLMSAGATAHRKGAPDIRWAEVFVEHVAFGKQLPGLAPPQEVARVWTGWFVINKQLRFVPGERDERPKTLLGQTGDLTVADLAQLVGRHPLSQEFIVRKLYHFFVSDEHEPSAELIRPLTELLARTQSVKAVVKRILRSNLFFSPLAYRAKIKTPVELVVGLARTWEKLIPTAALGEELAAIGQDLCDPPTFAGWPSGKGWIHHGTYLARKRLLTRLVGGPGGSGVLDPWATAQKHGKATSRDYPAFVLELVYQHDLEPPVREALQAQWEALAQARPFVPAQAGRAFLATVAALPEFELA